MRDKNENEHKKIAVFVGVVAILLVIVFLVHIKESASEVKKSAPVLSRLHQTIFVMIVHPFIDDTAVSAVTTPAASALIHSLFSTADEPSRVSVGVYDAGDSLFKHISPSHQTSVRFCRNMRKKAKHSSLNDAFLHLLRTAYRGERYVMTLSATATLTRPGWDSVMVGLHSKLAQTVRKPILTAPIVENAFGNGQTDVHFPTVQGVTRRRGLVVVPRRVALVVDEPFPVLTWSPDISFSRAVDFPSKIFVGDALLGREEDVTNTSANLFTNGNGFYSPPLVVAVSRVSSRVEAWGRRRRRGGGWNSGIGVSDEYAAFLGVSVARRKVSKRATNGLAPRPSPIEAMAKNGSIEAARVVS